MAFEAVIAGVTSLAETVSTAAGRIEADADRIKASADEIGKAVREAGSASNQRRINGIRAQIEEMAESGNFFAAQLSDVFVGIEEGLITTQEALEEFPRAVVEIEGKTIQLSSLLNELGLTTAQVQSDLQEFLKDVRGTEDEFEQIIDRVGQSSSLFARKVDDLARAVREGKRDLADFQALIDQLEDGSSLKTLAEQLRQILSDGGFG